MKLIIVTPIDRSIFKEELTYFSAKPLNPGSVVEVAIRQKKVRALVVATADAKDDKFAIRQADFSLRKIISTAETYLFLPAFLEAVEHATRYCAAGRGVILKSLVPQAILAEGVKVAHGHRPTTTPISRGTLRQNKFILQESDSERIAHYKSLVRESFAKKQSVFICVPTVADVERLATHFSAGIKEFTIVLHGQQTAKKQVERWKEALGQDHPLLVIATPLFLSLPRSDIGTYIFDQENSSSFKDPRRPFLDFRRFGEFLSEKNQARLIFGDLILRSETILRTEQGEFQNLSTNKYRSLSTAEQIIVANRKNAHKSDSLQALNDETRTVIGAALANRRKVLVFSGRQGLAPNTVCNDCGNIVSCPRCHSPFVLSKREKTASGQKLPPYFYACHKCGAEGVAEDHCPHCSSWRLTLLGFGLERVEEELEKLWPTVPRFRYDGKTIKSAGRGKTILQRFENTKGPALLLATESLVPLLHQPIDTIALVALDSLFSLPDFRISEKIFNLILKLRQYAKERLLIQTRLPEEKVFLYATAGNLIDFYRDEIAERLRFGYPPFKTLVMISQAGGAATGERAITTLADQLKKWQPQLYRRRSAESKKCPWHLLIRLPANDWPDEELSGFLRALSADFIVNVEPESIL